MPGARMFVARSYALEFRDAFAQPRSAAHDVQPETEAGNQ